MTNKPQPNSPHQWSAHDHTMMALALQLAKKGEFTARPNPMVGCVLTQQDKIIAQGWHQKAGQAHAEINALAEAGARAQGATCYVTLEPCAHFGKTGPCAQALIDAGIKKVIAAMSDPNPQVSGKGFEMLLDAGIQVETGLLELQATQLNRGFIKKFNQNKPWVTCKLAMSLDGRTALADGSSKWITGSAARNDVQQLRARQDAIITGIGTVLADDPRLNVRFDDNQFAGYTEITQPMRVLLDTHAKASPNAKIFNSDGTVLWLSDKFESKSIEGNLTKSLMPASLELLLNRLAENNFNQVLVEAGHRLAGEFLKQGLIDELVVYMAPKLMGSGAMALFDLEIKTMLEAPKLILNDIRQVGDDVRLTYTFQQDNKE